MQTPSKEPEISSMTHEEEEEMLHDISKLQDQVQKMSASQKLTEAKMNGMESNIKGEKAKKDNKLSPKYYGPYKVLQNIGTMAYKLELPVASWVHPIFHASCLKKVIGDNFPIQTIFPKLDGEGKIILEPKAVTKTRT